MTLIAQSMAAGLPAPTWLAPRLEHLLSVLLIACIAWLMTGFSFALEDWALAHFRTDVRDNLRARRIHT